MRDVGRIHKTLILSSADQGCNKNPSGLLYTDTRPVAYDCLLSDLLDLSIVPYSLRLVSWKAFDNQGPRHTAKGASHIATQRARGGSSFSNLENPMPPALDSFHRNAPDITGVCFARRFIAVFRGGSDLEDVVSHELVHAYVSSALGPGNGFEDWFNEGFALNIARTPVTSVLSGTAETGEYTTTLTAQYREYKHVFDRLEERLGRSRYLSTIACCIQSRSVAPRGRGNGSCRITEFGSLCELVVAGRPAALCSHTCSKCVGRRRATSE